MEKRKVIRKRNRGIKGMRRLIAAFLVIVMLSAASMSAVAFAVDAAEYDDGATVTVEAPEYTPAVEAPVVDESAEYVPVALEVEVEEAPVAEEVTIEEDAAEELYIEIEPLTGVLTTDDAYILADSISPGIPAADTGFDTLAEALNSAYAVPGVTINLQHDVSHGALTPNFNNLTLNLGGNTLTLAGPLAVDSAGSGFTLTGGTLNALGDGVVASGNAVVNINAAINAGISGIVADGTATVTVVGNIATVEGGAVVTLPSSSASVTVIGNLNTESSGVYADGNGTVTIYGDINVPFTGIASSLGAPTVIVTGNISSDFGIRAGGNAEIVVTGNIRADEFGISAGGNAEIVVTGNITSEGFGILVYNDEANDVNVHLIGDIVAMLGVAVWGNAQVRVTGAITADNYVSINDIDLASNESDATSALDGYRQFSRGNTIVWVYGVTGELCPDCGEYPSVCVPEPIPCPDCEEYPCGCVPQPTPCPECGEYPSTCAPGPIPCPDCEEYPCGCVPQPTPCPECGEYPSTCVPEPTPCPDCEEYPCGCVPGSTSCATCEEYPCVCAPYVPGGTPGPVVPGPGTPAPGPTAPPAGNVDGDDGDDADEDAAPANNRRPAAGPKTGDAVNVFAQIAVLAILVATVASAGLLRTREEV